MELWHLLFIIEYGSLTVVPILIGYLTAQHGKKYFETSFEESEILSEYFRKMDQEETKKRLKESQIRRIYDTRIFGQ